MCFFSSNISKENLKEKGMGSMIRIWVLREEGIIKEWEFDELRETWLNLCEEETQSSKKDNTLTSNIPPFYKTISISKCYHPFWTKKKKSISFFHANFYLFWSSISYSWIIIFSIYNHYILMLLTSFFLVKIVSKVSLNHLTSHVIHFKEISFLV